MMKAGPVPIRRMPELLVSDDKRVIPRYLDFQHPPRVRSIFRRLTRISARRARGLLEEVRAGFSCRHRDLGAMFLENYERAAAHCRNVPDLTRVQRELIGAYFSMEYSIEAAALFNPSMVEHPDQSGLGAGDVRFLMSLRATGEGHISSIVFRRGVMRGDGSLAFDPPPRWAYSARPIGDKRFDKSLFVSKLHEHGAKADPVQSVLKRLDDPFTPAQLRAALEKVRRSPDRPGGFKRLASTMIWLAGANYELHFPADCRPAETVIFPATPYETNGMEDLRLVRFVGDDGAVRYYGTYTAYDGVGTHPMLLETADFRHFHVSTLSGRYARNKGMALFPRKVGGHYLMVSRHDGENLFLLRSHDVTTWNVSKKLLSPREDWELVQLGNCGSPLETEEGWLLITHGVGPMRRYCIGAALLDRADPTRVIGRLREPLLAPDGEEREGYVPNVVYSCGSMFHKGNLVIPYAMSDSRTAFATVDLGELLGKLRRRRGRKAHLS